MSSKKTYRANPLIVVVASGYFNPLHSGHLEYLYDASNYGDILIVIVNNDKQVLLKNKVSFLDESERLQIIKSLDCVNCSVLSIDYDLSVAKTIELIRPNIFVNGGDRTSPNKQEEKVCQEINCEIKYNAGGTKIQSSSDILDSYYYERLRFDKWNGILDRLE